jgi:hypothetical protein
MFLSLSYPSESEAGFQRDHRRRPAGTAQQDEAAASWLPVAAPPHLVQQHHHLLAVPLIAPLAVALRQGPAGRAGVQVGDAARLCEAGMQAPRVGRQGGHASPVTCLQAVRPTQPAFLASPKGGQELLQRRIIAARPRHVCAEGGGGHRVLLHPQHRHEAGGGCCIGDLLFLGWRWKGGDCHEPGTGCTAVPRRLFVVEVIPGQSIQCRDAQVQSVPHRSQAGKEVHHLEGPVCWQGGRAAEWAVVPTWLSLPAQQAGIIRVSEPKAVGAALEVLHKANASVGWVRQRKGRSFRVKSQGALAVVESTAGRWPTIRFAISCRCFNVQGRSRLVTGLRLLSVFSSAHRWARHCEAAWTACTSSTSPKRQTLFSHSVSGVPSWRRRFQRL